jgi:uncharacterized protein YhfF
VPADVNAGSYAIDDPAKTVGNTAAGQNASFTFQGTAGQRIQAETTGSTFPSGVSWNIYRPDGSTVQPWYSWWGANTFVDTMTLDQTGTWKVVFDPPGATTGSMKFRAWNVPPDVTATYQVGDPTLRVTTTSAGQNAVVSFQATSGQQVRLATSNVNIPGGSVSWNIYRPDGSTVQPWYSWYGGNGVLDPLSITQTGTWKVVYDVSGTSTGSMDLTITNKPVDLGAMVLDGPTLTAGSLAAGQDGVWTISGSSGQRIAVETSGSTFTNVAWKLLAPSGTVLANGTGNSWSDVVTLPASGGYQLVVDPAGAETGSIQARAWTISADADAGTVTPGGAKVTVSVANPGQRAVARITGTAGQRLSLETTGSTFTGVDWKLVDPSGATMASGSGNGFVDPVTLVAAGTYQVVVDPVGQATGGIGLQAWTVPADPTSALTMGTAKSVTTSVPGQNARATFSGTVGQRVALQLASSTFSAMDWTLTDPAGTVLASGSGNGFQDALTLSTAGTYTVLVDPKKSATGSVAVTAYNVAADVNGGAITLGANKATTLTIGGVGQNGFLTISGTANQRLAFETSGSTFASVDWKLVAPSGAVLGTGVGNAFQDLVVLPAAGTYKIVVDPRGNATGKLDVKAWTVPADVNAGAITKGGAAVKVTIATAGQNGYVTYAGTAGQSVTFATTGGTVTSVAWRVLRPDGTTLTSGTGATASSGVLTLPTTGSYKLVVDPVGNATGYVNVKAS